jgi:hypothetical protein
MKYLKSFNEDLLYTQEPIDDLENYEEKIIPMTTYEKEEIKKFLKFDLPSFEIKKNSFRIENATKNYWRIVNRVENYVAGLFFKVDDDWFIVQIPGEDDEDHLYKCDDLIGLKKILKDKLNDFNI